MVKHPNVDNKKKTFQFIVLILTLLTATFYFDNLKPHVAEKLKTIRIKYFFFSNIQYFPLILSETMLFSLNFSEIIMTTSDNSIDKRRPSVTIYCKFMLISIYLINVEVKCVDI